MSAVTQCSKCSGTLERGFMIDREHMSFEGEAKWASGEPRRHILRWSSVESSERKLSVTTYRCTKCGYLESYATDSA